MPTLYLRKTLVQAVTIYSTTETDISPSTPHPFNAASRTFYDLGATSIRRKIPQFQNSTLKHCFNHHLRETSSLQDSHPFHAIKGPLAQVLFCFFSLAYVNMNLKQMEPHPNMNINILEASYN